MQTADPGQLYLIRRTVSFSAVMTLSQSSGLLILPNEKRTAAAAVAGDLPIARRT